MNSLFVQKSTLFVLLVTCQLLRVISFAPPFGIAALFRPKTLVFQPTLGDDDKLITAAKFFTDAFWAGKIGGADTLSQRQSKSLSNQQIAEFRKRYSLRVGADRRSELLICQDGETGEITGCAGIELSNISTANGKSVEFKAPLMSNLAVGKNFRRMSIAEDLVKVAEEMARKEWGYDEVYLYVEKRNIPAFKLYRKLGYTAQWEDDTSTTLIPTSRGTLVSEPTVIICMKKSLNGLSLGRFLPFL